MYIATVSTRFYPDQVKTDIVLPVGERISIRVMENEPNMAYFLDVDTSECIGTLTSHKLWHYFEEFPKAPRLADLQESLAVGCCPSLLGEEVEPDGWDEQGFPSYLLATGLI